MRLEPAIASDVARGPTVPRHWTGTQLGDAIERLGDGAAYQYAEINVALGDRDEAIRWLGVARRIKDPGLSYIAFDPLLDPLRNDRRFERLLRELGLVAGSG